LFSFVGIALGSKKQVELIIQLFFSATVKIVNHTVFSEINYCAGHKI
jgi:hypothetical protein